MRARVKMAAAREGGMRERARTRLKGQAGPRRVGQEGRAAGITAGDRGRLRESGGGGGGRRD